MKSTQLVLGMAIIGLSFTSCKDEKQAQAEKSVETYTVYVDSLENVQADEVAANWDAIEANYQMRIVEAESALENIKDNAKAKERIEASKAKYEALKLKMTPDVATADNTTAGAGASSKQSLRNALFGEGKIGDDMNFNWVTAKNIHSVYQQFVHTAEENKDSYSREDWDEVKLMYEALDSRKNTVEKEGLSSEDNRKIAGLKVKFSPMLTVNRMGAKSDEASEAKK